MNASFILFFFNMAIKTTTATSFDFISRLPNELCDQVWGYFPLPSLAIVTCVCKLWNEKILVIIALKKQSISDDNTFVRSIIEDSGMFLHKYFYMTFPPIPIQDFTNPTADRKALIDYCLSIQTTSLAGKVFTQAAAQGKLTICQSLLPPIVSGRFLSAGLNMAIQKGHLLSVKNLLPNIPKENLINKIHIIVMVELKKGQSLQLFGYMGEGHSKLISWNACLPIQRSTDDPKQHEIILLPSDETTELKFRPALQTDKGKIYWSKGEVYTINAGSQVTISPEFEDDAIQTP